MLKTSTIVIVIIFILGLIITIFNYFSNKKDESFSSILFTTGISLILDSFESNFDKILNFIMIILKITNSSSQKNSEIDFIKLFIGFVLVSLGIFYSKYINQKLFILNINGYQSFNKKIDDYRNELNLSKFEFKEREINFIRTYKKGVKDENIHEIIEEIKDKMRDFKNESKGFKRSYTGVASIPFIFFAGTEFQREKIDTFYEFNKLNVKYKKLSNRKIFNINNNKLELKTTLSSFSDAENFVFSISMTSEILDSQLIQFTNIQIIKFSTKIFKDYTIEFEEDLKEYKELIYNSIKDCINKFPSLKTIHIVYSGQSCLAFEIGTLIEDHSFPQIITYQFDSSKANKYPWGIVLNGPEKGKLIEYP